MWVLLLCPGVGVADPSCAVGGSKLLRTCSISRMPCLMHKTSNLQVARLARRLPTGDVGGMSVQLGGSGGGAAVGLDEAGEEDLT